jgi:hypothetical protein
MPQRGGFGSGAAGFGRRGMGMGGDIGGSRMVISYGGSYGGGVGGHGTGWAQPAISKSDGLVWRRHDGPGSRIWRDNASGRGN